jgi:hypothetical protein
MELWSNKSLKTWKIYDNIGMKYYIAFEKLYKK